MTSSLAVFEAAIQVKSKHLKMLRRADARGSADIIYRI